MYEATQSQVSSGQEFSSITQHKVDLNFGKALMRLNLGMREAKG